MNNNNMIDCPCCNEKKQNLNTSVRYVDVKFKSEENQELFNNRKLILCTNCNFAKGMKKNKNKCPHEKQRLEETFDRMTAQSSFEL